MSAGASARLRIDALGDQVYEGLITRIYPTLDPVSRRGTIDVELQPVPEGAAPGQLCRVELGTHAAQRRVIPFSALRRDEESEYVFVLDADSKAQRVNVQSGLRLAEKIEITEGLEDGQQVITRGFLGLTSGKKVKPVESGTRGQLAEHRAGYGIAFRGCQEPFVGVQVQRNGTAVGRRHRHRPRGRPPAGCRGVAGRGPVPAGPGVQVSGGFVREDELGLFDEGTGDGYPLPLSA